MGERKKYGKRQEKENENLEPGIHGKLLARLVYAAQRSFAGYGKHEGGGGGKKICRLRKKKQRTNAAAP